MLKSVSSVANAIGALNYKGTWNATTNTPALASGSGTKGDYYQVGVAGSTTLDGVSNWGVGDIAAFNGTTWQRIEGGADLNGVNLTVTGVATIANENLVIGTSGKGIDFSANSHAAGMTSELLNDYEEGVWTPNRMNFTEVLGGGSITSSGIYTKIGNVVHLHADIVCAGGATIAAIAGTSYFSGQPFNSSVGAGGTWVNTTNGGLGGMWINTGNIFIVKTSWIATSATFMFDCTYTV